MPLRSQSRALPAAAVLACLLVAGCEPEPPIAAPLAADRPATVPAAAATTDAPEPTLDLPGEVTVRQRSTTDVAGGALRLTIDDITRAQVMASLVDKEGLVLLAPTSLAAGESATFRFGGLTCMLTLKELSNALVGEDFATFDISAASPETEPDDPPAIDANELTEAAKIELLIAQIRSMDSATFIRNGAEHNAEDAADHLQSKWEMHADQIATAEQFIDEIATKSSLSGEPYLIRQKDGSTLPAGDYLRKVLAGMTSNDR